MPDGAGHRVQRLQIQPSIDGARPTPTKPATNAAVKIGGASRPAGCTDADQGGRQCVVGCNRSSINIPFWNDVTITPTIKAVFRCEWGELSLTRLRDEEQGAVLAYGGHLPGRPDSGWPC